MKGLDAYLTPPDPEPFLCLTHGEDECTLEDDDCEQDDGCSWCDAPMARLCRCDDEYERFRERDDDPFD